MFSKFKTVITLIRQRFDILEADMKAIKISQQNINRRLDAIEARLNHRNELYSRIEKRAIEQRSND